MDIQNAIVRTIVTLFYFHGAVASGGLGPPYFRGFTITLRHTHSVVLLRTSDKSDAETSI
jgi:hypothetical protein